MTFVWLWQITSRNSDKALQQNRFHSERQRQQNVHFWKDHRFFWTSILFKKSIYCNFWKKILKQRELCLARHARDTLAVHTRIHQHTSLSLWYAQTDRFSTWKNRVLSLRRYLNSQIKTSKHTSSHTWRLDQTTKYWMSIAWNKGFCRCNMTSTSRFDIDWLFETFLHLSGALLGRFVVSLLSWPPASLICIPTCLDKRSAA